MTTNWSKYNGIHDIINPVILKSDPGIERQKSGKNICPEAANLRSCFQASMNSIILMKVKILAHDTLELALPLGLISLRPIVVKYLQFFVH